ncbi:MAG TPA: MucB/RseB C-terminal domain-containing protein [Casimicrobiaceae bacterium]|jgi:sigma-E factor negative regulatory protein RseB|nr:MucB/RseB C-terminal domain-containing protein [Casimicrobiaceae bacterium]
MTASPSFAAATRATGRSLRRALLAPAAVVTLAFAPHALAQDAQAMLDRAATAARTLSYTGTIVYQRGSVVETTRIVHVSDGGEELEKLVNLDGPAREVIRNQGEVRCYYPDAKLVRIEPRTFRNAFPSLSPKQQASLAQFYAVKKGGTGRVAGIEAQAWTFVPRDGLRYGHEFWTDPATGMLLKARTLNEAGEVIEQFAFLEIAQGVKLDRDAARPTWASAPADWQVKHTKMGVSFIEETGWTVTRVPPGFTRIMEGRRGLRDRPDALMQIVLSDGLVAVSVFIEARGGSQRYVGRARQGGINQYSVKQDDYVITALGEAPAEAVRMIATSVTRR